MAKDDLSPIDIRYGKRLRELREERGLTQADLVQRMQQHGHAHMNTSTLSRIEAGVRPVRLTEAQTIGRMLQVSPASMTADDEDIAFYESRARQARQVFVSFRGAVEDVTSAQLKLERYLPHLRELAQTEIPDELREAVEHTISNIEGYVVIDLAAEATALSEETRANYSRNTKTEAGRFLNARNG